MDEAGSYVHQTNIKLRPPKKVPTPYGGRLVYVLPGKTKLFVHLKVKNPFWIWISDCTFDKVYWFFKQNWYQLWCHFWGCVDIRYEPIFQILALKESLLGESEI